MPYLTFTGTGNFSGKIQVYYDIAQSDLSKQTIQANDVVYTNRKGKFKAVPVLTDAVSGKKLAAGIDYEKVLTYTYVKDNGQQDNKETVDSQAVPETHTKIRVTATGKGKYQGEISAVYEIVAASVAGAKVTVKDQTYTGQKCLPTKADIVVTVGKTKLTADDYEIVEDGSDITNVGKHTFKIVGKGNNYGGVKSVSFKIKKKSFLWWFINK
jgi:hypothetical protein